MAERQPGSAAADRAYLWRLHRILALYVAGVLGFLALMTWAEHQGLSRHWIGPIFLFLTVMVYAGIGVYGRTTDPEDYYVAGRRIPPMYNGMATAADWMSAASFISLSGALYLQGFSGTPGQAGGLAYLLESQVSPVHVQKWQFYVTTFSLFLVLAFPGFIARFFWKRRA